MGVVKEYLCIVKTGDSKFLKYHVNDLLKFTKFLDTTWSDWKFFNVFDKKTENQIASFTINDRPTKAKLSQHEVESFTKRATKDK